jgi:acyl-CoA synthetase (AMP-forming)/AMP-acid ligase II
VATACGRSDGVPRLPRGLVVAHDSVQVGKAVVLHPERDADGSTLRVLDPSGLETVLATSEDDAWLVLCGCGQVGEWGMQAVIRDPESQQQLGDLCVGEICLQSGSKAQGYWRRPELSAETFEATVLGPDGVRLAGSFLRTGDLGFVFERELFVSGRLKDMLILRGRNVYPQDVEFCAQAASALLRPGCLAVFGVDAEVANGQVEECAVLVAELQDAKASAKDRAALVAAVRQAVLAECGVSLHAVSLLRPRTIDKTSSGKIRRRMAKERWSSKKYGKDLVATTLFAVSNLAPSTTSEATASEVPEKKVSTEVIAQHT